MARTWLGGAAARLLGALVPLALFGIAPLNPANEGWLWAELGVDPIQSWLGWTAFRQAPWALPPGANAAYGMELGARCAFPGGGITIAQRRGQPMMNRRQLGIPLLAFAAHASGARRALAQGPAWPGRAISFVVPAAAGSAVDVVARLVAEGWATRLGVPVVVDNRISANGAVALGQVARASPDGYTVLVTIQTHIAFNPFIYANLPYEPLRDFAAVTQLAAVTNALVVPAASPHRSVQDLVAAARAHPGGLTYSSAAVGSTHHISSALLADRAGLTLIHVPYRGGPAAQVAVQTGQVDFAILNIPPLLGAIRAGALRALAVTSEQRSALLPDTPTMQEAGIADYRMSTWMGLATVAGTPPAVIDRMHEVTREVLADEAGRQRLVALGFDLVPQLTPAEMTALHRDDHARWGAFLRAARIRAE